LSKQAELDTEIAETIASYAESWSNADLDELCATLVAHPKPKVRRGVSGNASMPKKHLKTLLKDEDVDVRGAARRSLK
jgi:hypothetical protein